MTAEEVRDWMVQHQSQPVNDALHAVQQEIIQSAILGKFRCQPKCKTDLFDSVKDDLFERGFQVENEETFTDHQEVKWSTFHVSWTPPVGVVSTHPEEDAKAS